MQPYKDITGDSGVSGYQIRQDSIAVRFKEGSTYLYTYTATGKAKVEKMKSLAANGQGLSTYISRHVKDQYAAKLS